MDTQFSDLRCLVIGTGSIGKRHINNLLAFDVKVGVYSTGHGTSKLEEPRIALYTESWDDAVKFKPHVVVIANPTALHHITIQRLAAETAYIFVEKPLANNIAAICDVVAKHPSLRGRLIVGYNYRFHAAIHFLKEVISKSLIGNIQYIKCQVGQYLPDWHPGEDYRLGYVARSELGGGVLRTLSHEIDYVDFLISQEISELSCITSNISDLEIDVEDTANVNIRYQTCMAEIHMDMVRKIPVREMNIYGDKGYLKWDDMEDRILMQDKEKKVVIWESSRNERDESFKKEMQVLLRSVHQKTIDERFGNPLRTMQIIDKCLISAQQKHTISWKR